ncbi:hypothetical protein A8F94_14300 [Bacillus sp. FJAT-27225]|uniref:hypothetical protein n=1 Tax=Bacillus sp. FJAT-27225 TaxID=1743144 RepID=UPI00080C2577|nr:hypothetical protein [Bacillus sp. FJAT-27225]OCA86011.1 hypothetical protein A8F94_14300 [Bacillus sp. FJAT-27225]
MGKYNNVLELGVERLNRHFNRRDIFRIPESAEFQLTDHFMERLEERIKPFANKKAAKQFCRKALLNQEINPIKYKGKQASKVISQDLVFIVDMTNLFSIKLITVYPYNGYYLNWVG